jgi:hypothetical protein
MDEGLAEFKKAAELFSSSGYVLRQYGNAMLNYGRVLRRSSLAASGKVSQEAIEMVTKAKAAISRAGELEAADLEF